MPLKDVIFGSHKAAQIKKETRYEYSVEELLPVPDIIKGVIITSDGRHVKILQVLPINIEKKSELQRSRIIFAFAALLKIAPNTLQIRVMTEKSNIRSYISQMQHHYKVEPVQACADMMMDHIRDVECIAENSISHCFYLIYEYEPHMRAKDNSSESIADRMNEEADVIRTYMNNCGLHVVEPMYEDNAALEILYKFLCKDTSSRLRLPDGVFDMMVPVHGVYDDDIRIEISDDPAEEKKRKKKQRFFGRKPRKKDPDPIKAGATLLQDIIGPVRADLSSDRFVLVDDVYHSYLYITGYGYTQFPGDGWLKPIIEAGEGVHLNFIIQRQPRVKILNKINNATKFNRSRMRDVDDSRQDYEEIDGAIDAGVFLKSGMNRDNEDFYYMHTIIEVTAYDPETLEQRISNVERLCMAVEMVPKRCSYFQEQAFMMSLPLLYIDENIARKSRRNVLTTGAASSFPFASYELIDEGGIYVGRNMRNNSSVIVNFMDDAKYSNGHLCCIGSSGAGKTVTMQAIASRERYQQKRIFVIAPKKGHEYRALCEHLDGAYVRRCPASSDCINIMEIRRTTLDGASKFKSLESRNDSLLAQKISRLHIWFSLLRKDMTDDDVFLLDTAFVECYSRFGITHDNESLLNEDGTRKKMPIVADLYYVLAENPETHHLSNTLKRFVTGSASQMTGETNIDLKSMYYVFDITDAPKELVPSVMFEVSDFILDYIQEFDTNYLVENSFVMNTIVLGEIWNLIGVSSTPQAAEFVVELIKTVRGLGGHCIIETQDLIDFFALEDGKYGKAILNNSRIKLIMHLEEDEARIMQEHLNLSDEEVAEIVACSRGEGLLCIGANRINVKIDVSDLEYQYITTSPTDMAALVKAGQENEKNEG